MLKCQKRYLYIFFSDATVWKFESRFGFRFFYPKTAVSVSKKINVYIGIFF